jgi:hypothetical protein
MLPMSKIQGLVGHNCPTDSQALPTAARVSTTLSVAAASEDTTVSLVMDSLPFH